MSTVAMALDSDATMDTFLDRLRKEFSDAAEQWSRCLDDLNQWEREHLLGIENPPAEKLARHRTIVDRLLRFGQLCVVATSHPDFADEATSDMVNATQRVLRHKLEMFHNPMSEEAADRILQEVFPES